MTTKIKHHPFRDLRDDWRSMHNRQRGLTLAAVLIALCFLVLGYSDADRWLLQLLYRIGSDCVWCSIVPS